MQQGVQSQVKTVPVRIIQNQGSQPYKLPKLNLRFQPEEQQVIEAARIIPTVTVPLSFLQQLIYLAQQNKQLRSINNTIEERSDACAEELIKDITQQKEVQNFQQPIEQESVQIQNKLLKLQIDFIKNSDISREFVQTYFMDNIALLPHYQRWIQQIEVNNITDMLVLCNAEQKNPQYIDIFKTLFQRLSFDFYAKHAYVITLRSNDKNKQQVLEQIGEISGKIARPQEYFYFSKKL
ncbi:hypothetical protein pb186bvf_016394 [Paramecium bursaria]